MSLHRFAELLMSFKDAKEVLTKFEEENSELITLYKDLQEQVEILQKELREYAKELPVQEVKSQFDNYGFHNVKVYTRTNYHIQPSTLLAKYPKNLQEHLDVVFSVKATPLKQLIQLGELPSEAEELMSASKEEITLIRGL